MGVREDTVARRRQLPTGLSFWPLAVVNFCVAPYYPPNEGCCASRSCVQLAAMSPLMGFIPDDLSPARKKQPRAGLLSSHRAWRTYRCDSFGDSLCANSGHRSSINSRIGNRIDNLELKQFLIPIHCRRQLLANAAIAASRVGSAALLERQ